MDGFVTTKRTADGGIDGRLYFAIPREKALQSMAIEVKGGKNVNIAALRALQGTLDNDEALMAGLITMEPLGDVKDRNFHKYMAQAGDLEVDGVKYSRLQMLTVGDNIGREAVSYARRGWARSCATLATWGQVEKERS